MRDFLEWLWGTGNYGELRTIHDAGHIRQSWYYLPGQIANLVTDARALDEGGWDVYMGVLPRVAAGGKAIDVPRYTDVLWFDIDAKHHGSKHAALNAILDFEVPPSCIIDSGHGYHCYIRLDGHIIFEDAQRVMKGIARRIGGDPVYDAARILRLPGTHNHKEREVVPVRLIRFDTTLVYPFSDLAEFEYVEPPTPSAYWTVINQMNAHPPLLDLDFDPGKGLRSDHDYGVVCWMIEHGWEDNEIIHAFMTHPEGVGVKTSISGVNYLERTIRKARRAVR